MGSDEKGGPKPKYGSKPKHKGKPRRRLSGKLDPRLSILLSMRLPSLLRLAREEVRRLQAIEEELASVEKRLARAEDPKQASEIRIELSQVFNRLFAPLTAGMYHLEHSQDPLFSVIIRSEASGRDLNAAGAQVRCKVGDLFTAYVPWSEIHGLAQLPIVQRMELARPLFPDLSFAIPYANISPQLHNAVPAIRGRGVVVGVIDSYLDVYHPAFRKDTDTRVLFLWDQTLRVKPAKGETSPPVDPVLPGFMPTGGLSPGTSYGVEYDEHTINDELAHVSPAHAYNTVRHKPGNVLHEHGTAVTGCAAGNGRTDLHSAPGANIGAAPEADIIFVRPRRIDGSSVLADSAHVRDAFSYVFARAADLGKPCVVNLSLSDDQGPHDGSSEGEAFLDGLLSDPGGGRAIIVSAGNSNGYSSHAMGFVDDGDATTLILKYSPSVHPPANDAIEIWYDGNDRFDVRVTVKMDVAGMLVVDRIMPPMVDPALIPGAPAFNGTLTSGVGVKITSLVDASGNHGRCVRIEIDVTTATVAHPDLGTWEIALQGVSVFNGRYHAWVDRNNRSSSDWAPPVVDPHFELVDDRFTLSVPGTARSAITVGNHKHPDPLPASAPPGSVPPAPLIQWDSGRGPTRDGRVKPEIAAVGAGVVAPRARLQENAEEMGLPAYITEGFSGTSASAPIVAGACALLFQSDCRGSALTWADVKQILIDFAERNPPPAPSDDFGFGYLQMSDGAVDACTAPLPTVDVWLKDDASDSGLEPFSGPSYCDSPDVNFFDATGTSIPNPIFDPNPLVTFTTEVVVTVRNRGSSPAANTEVFLYWADPGTLINFPADWRSDGLFVDDGGTKVPGNRMVVPMIAQSGGTADVSFFWKPPAPGSNIGADDHFCLLVRLETAGDPSLIGTGGWVAIPAHNNIACRNTHVQTVPSGGASAMAFFMKGSSGPHGSEEQDSLVVWTELEEGNLSVVVPIQALPWRDATIVGAQNFGGRLPRYGEHLAPLHPLAHQTLPPLLATEIEERTDVQGAKVLQLQAGLVRIAAGQGGRITIPLARLAPGARMPVRVAVTGVQTNSTQRFVRAEQRSSGRRVGMVTLEVRTPPA